MSQNVTVSPLGIATEDLPRYSRFVFVVTASVTLLQTLIAAETD